VRPALNAAKDTVCVTDVQHALAALRAPAAATTPMPLLEISSPSGSCAPVAAASSASAALSSNTVSSNAATVANNEELNKAPTSDTFEHESESLVVYFCLTDD